MSVNVTVVAKVYISFENEKLSKESIQSIAKLLFRQVEVVESPERADLIIVADKKSVLDGYDKNKTYLVISNEPVKGLPTNVFWSHVSRAVPAVGQCLSMAMKHDFNDKQNLPIGVKIKPQKSKFTSLNILVVDDIVDNLQMAFEQLGDCNLLTLANSYDMAMALLSQNKYEAVLTDCQMPIGIYHSAMCIQSLDMATKVHNGFLILFAATFQGARCAVVTDANHHQDWVSAAFDDLSQQNHTVNGQKVLFVNNRGKDWKYALDKLFED